MSKKIHLIHEVSSTPNFPELEKELLLKWQNEGIVSEYLHRNDSSKRKFFFQDGPITANNPMGVHHAWGRTYKDVFQRYYNMRGFRQRFQNGFDCQGLWVEVEVEKDLGFKSKKDIETYGVAEFVEKCKERVLKYSAIQTDQSKRLGYFMDWDHSYFTMSESNNYMIWHFLKVCFEKGWIYKGHESVPWCPRCETAISQHEMLTEDYKELTHKSIYLELPIIGRDREFLLIWTTTPWTIPANIAVTVDKKLTYSLVEGSTGNKFWVLQDLVEKVFGKEYKQIVKTAPGKELVGLKYHGPFDDLPAVKEVSTHPLFHTVVATDNLILPISNEEGTGLVHTAVSAGTEDFLLGRKLGLPMIPIIGDNADYLPNLGFLTGQNAKKHPEIILDYLKSRETDGEDWVFAITNYTHRYPACWRCKTELVWKVADEWYISMDKSDPSDPKQRTLRQQMVTNAKRVHWKPGFGLDRELDWLKNMHDWLISKKNRYWGLALPIWVCEKCATFTVVGGKEELKNLATSGFEQFSNQTPHKPYIDQVKLTCSCGGQMSRVGDVGNPWLDAGIVQFSTLVDPVTGQVSYTTDQKYFHDWFPADFITESFPGQFKNWFYSMLVMGTVLEHTTPYKEVLGFASMLGEDGRAMHKSWGNAIEFNEAADKIGADIMRWTFLRHNPERNLLFGFKVTGEVKRQFHMILWNSYRFFANNAILDNWSPKKHHFTKLLDQWVISRLNSVTNIVTKALDNKDAMTATLAMEAFINDFSTWYIRRSRDRVGPTSIDKSDRDDCYQTMFDVLTTFSRLLMPFNPFLADQMYTNLTGEQTVHLSNWPKTGPVDEALVSGIAYVRQICELGHASRKQSNIAVKQPLSKITIHGQIITDPELLQLIKEELNIENIVFVDSANLSIVLDTQLTDELLAKGKTREIIRAIQQARKDSNCATNEHIDLILPEWPSSHEEDIRRKTLSDSIVKGESLQIIRKV